MKNEDIIKLFENEFFLRLLDNRTNRNQINDPQKSSENLESQSTKLLASDLINDISEEINGVISFNLKSALADQFTSILEGNHQLQKDVEQLKENVLKLSIKISSSSGFYQGNPAVSDDFSNFQESLEKEKVRLEEKNKQCCQLIKLKNEIQTIKLSILRFTGTDTDMKEPRQPLRQQNLPRPENSKLLRLAKDIQTLSICSPSLDDNSINLDRYNALQKQIQFLNDAIENRTKQDAVISQKYETSFRSVWNVVTMMECSIAEAKMQIQDRLGQVGKKSGGIMDKMFK